MNFNSAYSRPTTAATTFRRRPRRNKRHQLNNPAMCYQIEFLPVALAQLLALPKDIRRLIGRKIDRLQDDLASDVKKLKGFKNKYRLRAGNYRVLFELEGGTIVVYDLGDRKDIYE